MENIDQKGNRIIGDPAAANAQISFSGENNILWCEPGGVELGSSIIRFQGSNAVVVLCRSKHTLNLNLNLNNNCSLTCGEDVYTNGRLNIITSEETHVFIGHSSMFSFGIWMRTADPHLIYDVQTHQRINPSQNILLGDHIWVGQDAMILKGTRVGSGSIIGAKSLVSGKQLGSNSIYAGNPAKFLRGGIHWDEKCVHTWTGEQTRRYQKDTSDTFCYEPQPGTDGFASLETSLEQCHHVEDRLKLLLEYRAPGVEQKNRFALPISDACSTAANRHGNRGSASTRANLWSRLTRQHQSA